MKKRIINTAGCIYVVFAIFVAYSAAGARQASVANHQDSRSDVETNHGSTVSGARMVRGKNTKLVVWSIPGCSGCVTFKRQQLPAIIAAGVYVEALDASVTPPEDDSITSYPTIILYDGDKEIGRWVGDTPAETILAFVPEEEEIPPYILWDNIKRWLGAN